MACGGDDAKDAGGEDGAAARLRDRHVLGVMAPTMRRRARVLGRSLAGLVCGSGSLIDTRGAPERNARELEAKTACVRVCVCVCVCVGA